MQQENQNDEALQLDIQKNLIQYTNLSQFQKIVLSLVSGLSATQDELQALQREFIRLDKHKKGTIDKSDLEQMTHSSLKKSNINWEKVIAECDQNGDGQIDFQEFMSACINRKALTNSKDVKTAFNILDENNDGQISI